MTKQSRKLMMGAVTGAAVLATGQANAFQYSAGDVTGYLDTTLKFGGIIRAEERNPDPRTHSLGNLNYDEGDLANFTFTGTVDFGISYGDYGAFVRASAVYDPIIEDKSDAEVPQDAKDIAGSDAKILDSYVYGNWIIGDQYLSARIGKQVINWGESLFTANGLNVVNPVDLAALRVPGAELKEGLIPVNSIWFSTTLTENLSLEAYYKIEWEQVLIDPVGTYFSSSDAVGDGSTNFLGIPLQAVNGNKYPDADEYGISFKYIVEDWDSAEIGFYAIRYNSSAPGLQVTLAPGAVSYNEIYAEAIDLYGLTLSTVLFEHSVSVEYSYRTDMPVSTALVDLTVPGSYTPIPGTIPGKARVPVGQLLINDVYAYGPNNPIGADQFSTAIEVGYVRNFGYGEADFKAGVNGFSGLVSGATTTDARTTRSAWGGRIRISADYNNAIGNWTLKPLLDLKTGFNGKAANGSFQKDVHGITTSLEGVLLSKYSLQLVYSKSFGGKSTDTPALTGLPYSNLRNSSIDRDYIGFNGKVSF